MVKKNKIVPKTILNNKYEKHEVLGSGGFGTIYRGFDTDEKRPVAIKAECLYSGHDQLPKEYVLYKKIGKTKGFLEVYDFFRQGQNQYLVFTLVGDSLEKVMHNNTGRKLDLKSTLMIAIQLIRQIQSLHEKNYLHRDIKPDNMAFGIGPDTSTLYILDLGLGKEFIRHGQHIAMNSDKNLVGTARYASLNSHQGLELSRRDDLESIAYVLIYLMKGTLPWQGLHSDYRFTKYDKVKRVKAKCKLDDLCCNLEPEFKEFLSYARNLKYTETPDYKKCIGLFEKCMARKKFVNDDIYPWTKPTDPAAVKVRLAKEAEEDRIRRARLLARRKKLLRKFRYPASTVDKFFSDYCGLTLEQKQAIIRQNMLEGAAFPTLAPPMFPPPLEDLDTIDDDIIALIQEDTKTMELSPIQVPAIKNVIEEKEEGEITNTSISTADDQEVYAVSENGEDGLQGQSRSALDSVVPRGTNVVGVKRMLEYSDENQLATNDKPESLVNDNAEEPYHTALVVATGTIEESKVDEHVGVKRMLEYSDENQLATNDKPESLVNDNAEEPYHTALVIATGTIEESKVDEATLAEDAHIAAPVVEEKKVGDKRAACAMEATAIVAPSATSGTKKRKKNKKSKKRKMAENQLVKAPDAKRRKTAKEIQAEMAAMIAEHARQELEAKARLERKQIVRRNYHHTPYIQPNHHLLPPTQQIYTSHQTNNKHQLQALPPSPPSSQYSSYQYNSSQVIPYQANQMVPNEPYQKQSGPVLPKFQQRQAPFMNQPRTTFNPQFGIPGQQQPVHRSSTIDCSFLF